MEFLDQAVTFTFTADKYNKGKKNRSLKNVKQAAAEASLVNVGKALSSLQKDQLTKAIVTVKSDLAID